MKRYYIINFVLGLFVSINVMSQGKNRVAIQTGLFHYWFDNTPIINSEKIVNGNAPHDMFGGYLNDSWGLLYEREINENSSFSVEYMSLKTVFHKGGLSSYYEKENPFIISKTIKSINVNYNRRIKLLDKLQFIYGGGLNYIWGKESIFLVNNFGTKEYSFNIFEYKRTDIAINIRSGIEYELIDWLTIYTNIDFLGIVYWEDKNGSTHEKTSKYIKENYGLKNIPSRFDLSWRFGIGINFGK